MLPPIDPTAIILILRPTDKEGAGAIRRRHNAALLFEDVVTTETVDDQYNDATADPDRTPSVRAEVFPEIRLNLDHTPRCREGYVFGSDESAVDVLIGTRKDGVSRIQFGISVNWVSKLALLTNRSRRPMSLSCKGFISGSSNLDSGETHVLSPDLTTTIKIGRLRFLLDPPPRDLESEHIYSAKIAGLAAQWEKLPALVRRTHASLAASERTASVLGKRTRSSSRPLMPRHRLKLSTLSLTWQEMIGGSDRNTQVWRVINTSNGDPLAAKVFIKDRARENLELEIVSRLSHVCSSAHDAFSSAKAVQENLVKFVDIASRGEFPAMLTVFRPYGDLLNFVHAKMEPADAFSVVRQIADVLAYLNEEGFVHCDVKPPNILVVAREPLKVELADFDIAHRISDVRISGATPKYRASECDDPSLPKSALVDMWSLGVVCLECLHELPEPEGDFQNTITWTKAIEGRAAHIASNFGLYGDVIGKLLSIDPEKRMNAKTCAEKLRNIMRVKEF